jgi:hypothetical protein
VCFVVVVKEMRDERCKFGMEGRGDFKVVASFTRDANVLARQTVTGVTAIH